MPDVSKSTSFKLVMRPGVAPDRVVGKKIPPLPHYREFRESGLDNPFTHTQEQHLQQLERVALDIEIWPSSTLFRTGQQLRLIGQGRDVADHTAPNAPFARHEDTRNRGNHMLLTEAQYDSHLLIP